MKVKVLVPCTVRVVPGTILDLDARQIALLGARVEPAEEVKREAPERPREAQPVEEQTEVKAKKKTAVKKAAKR